VKYLSNHFCVAPSGHIEREKLRQGISKRNYDCPFQRGSGRGADDGSGFVGNATDEATVCFGRI